MATIGQIRGSILEEAVLYLLKKVGYKIVRSRKDSIDDSDLHDGGSGLELQGRGTWHHKSFTINMIQMLHKVNYMLQAYYRRTYSHV